MNKGGHAMKFLKLTVENHVAVVMIARAPANALSSQLIQELSQLFDQLKTNEEVRVVLLHGEGKFFSAGADIKELTEYSVVESAAKNGQEVLDKMEQLPKPVIAAIHGAALGGGLELAMACHIRLVTEKAKLGLPELQLGIIPGFAGTQRLPRYVGTAKAAEMMFTSEPITGTEAVEWGLANHAYTDEELLPKAKEMAAKIAKKGPIALKAVIELLNISKPESYYQGVKKEAELFTDLLTTEDGKEGITAFIEKRDPIFTGK
jgi:enoyl-CoA hydratase